MAVGPHHGDAVLTVDFDVDRLGGSVLLVHRGSVAPGREDCPFCGGMTPARLSLAVGNMDRRPKRTARRRPFRHRPDSRGSGVAEQAERNAVTTIEDPHLASGAALDDELADLAKEYAEARDLVNEATARKDEARQRIIALMEPGKVAAGGFLITVSEQSRTTLDTKALRRWAEREGFDLAPYEKVSTSTVLRVT
jgi:hypothetical protein